MSGAAALAHDVWVKVVRHGEAPEREELRVARIATLVMGALAIALGIVLQGQNIALAALRGGRAADPPRGGLPGIGAGIGDSVRPGALTR